MKEFDPRIFWEWCGFSHKECDIISGSKCLGGHLISPDGEIFYGEYDYPEFTLDNLFKWVMPRLYSYRIGGVSSPSDANLVQILYRTRDGRIFRSIAKEINLTDAIKRDIWQIICEEIDENLILED